MNKFKQELEELLNIEPFQPFTITATDGFAIAIRSPKRALVSSRMLVVVNEDNGFLHYFPFTGIAHITTPQ